MKAFKKNIYKTESEVVSCLDVTIGAQIWTGCNLNVSEFRDGTPIPEITDPALWYSATTPAWCHYGNSTANGIVYGKLYNWYAVADVAHGGLAPSGYHIPTISEWNTLLTTVGGISVAGGELKEIGFSHWLTPNTGAVDTFNFTALGNGYRDGTTGVFYSLKQYAELWASDLYLGSPLTYTLSKDSVGITSHTGVETLGAAIRLVKD